MNSVHKLPDPIHSPRRQKAWQREWFTTLFDLAREHDPTACLLVQGLPEGEGQRPEAGRFCRSVEDLIQTIHKLDREAYLVAVAPQPRSKAAAQVQDLTAVGVSCIIALYADIDHAKKDPEGRIQRTLAAVRQTHELGIPPSAAVCSGRGSHLYWLLKEPVPATSENTAVWRRVNAHITSLFDDGDKSVGADVARKLRAPGSHNHRVPGQAFP